MGVNKEEFLTGSKVLENCPCGNTGNGAVPPLRSRNIRCLGKPETPPIDQLNCFFPIKDRNKFIRVGIIVTTPLAYICIVFPIIFQPFQLWRTSFLYAYHCRPLFGNHRNESSFTDIPSFILFIIGIIITYIERHNLNLIVIQRRIFFFDRFRVSIKLGIIGGGITTSA